MKRTIIVLACCLGASGLLAKDRQRPDASMAAKGCEWAGPGFVKIEGSDTCVRVGGGVRADVPTTRTGTADIQWK